MEELFETLDSDSSVQELSPQLKKGYKDLAPWIKFAAIAGIVSQSISFLLSFFNPDEGIVASVIGTAIGIALNITLLQFSNEMTNFSKTGTKEDLETMFKKELGYWIFLGVVCILALVFLLLGLIALSATGGPF
jgi:hypothetical protein